MATLSDGTTVLTLPDDLQWVDELSWRQVSQQVDRSITGALIVQLGVASAGRPITLASDGKASGWVSRALIDQLQAWSATPGLSLTLVYRGVARSVLMRHQDGAVDAAPLMPYADVQVDDDYTLTLRLMTV